LSGALILGEETDTLRAETRALFKKRRTKIVVQLDEVHRLDSVGVGTLLDAVKRARAAGGDLHLAQLSKTAANVLSLLALINRPDLLRIFDDPQQAVAAFSPPT
jgi:anti-sigma B factor antagonist